MRPVSRSARGRARRLLRVGACTDRSVRVRLTFGYRRYYPTVSMDVPQQRSQQPRLWVSGWESRVSAKVRFYMFPGSNSCLTGRLMLEHKGVDYKTVKVTPGVHAFTMLARGFQTMGVPALEVEGRRVQGTRAISRFLDQLVPARPLFPDDPRRRRAVEDAERWGEEFQNATRRVFYAGAKRDRKAFASVMSAERALPMRVFLRVGRRFIVRVASGSHRASDDAVREDLELLPERLEQIDRWIEAGLLNGPELNAADFQIAANISALLRCDDLVSLIAGRPAATLARRVAPDYAGHLAAVFPAEWLVPLRPGTEAQASDGALASVLRAAGVEEARIATIVRPGG